MAVFSGSSADPRMPSAQLDTLKHRFGLSRVTIVGDRGRLTHARLREVVKPAGYDWVTALRKSAIRSLVQQKAIQLSLFDEKDMAELTATSIRESASLYGAIRSGPNMRRAPERSSWRRPKRS